MQKSVRTLVVLMIPLLVSGTATAGLKTVKKCSSEVAQDARAVANFIDNHWAEFEAYLVANSKAKLIKKCLENRFRKNGKVICKSAKGKCSCTARKKKKGKCANGWASYPSRKCHLCATFYTRISGYKTADRRACMAAIMTHEFGHTCWRGHRTTEDFDNAAFKFWKKHHPGVTISLAHCGTD